MKRDYKDFQFALNRMTRDTSVTDQTEFSTLLMEEFEKFVQETGLDKFMDLFADSESGVGIQVVERMMNAVFGLGTSVDGKPNRNNAAFLQMENHYIDFFTASGNYAYDRNRMTVEIPVSSGYKKEDLVGHCKSLVDYLWKRSHEVACGEPGARDISLTRYTAGLLTLLADISTSLGWGEAISLRTRGGNSQIVEVAVGNKIRVGMLGLPVSEIDETERHNNWHPDGVIPRPSIFCSDTMFRKVLDGTVCGVCSAESQLQTFIAGYCGESHLLPLLVDRPGRGVNDEDYVYLESDHVPILRDIKRLREAMGQSTDS